MTKRIALLAGEQRDNESSRAVQACNDYLRMGPGRSLRKLAQKYGKTRQNPAPTDSLNTLEEWSSEFGWQIRAMEYDAGLEAEKNARRRKEFEAGLALDFQRVRALKKLAKFLEGEIFTRAQKVGAGEEGEQAVSEFPNVWLHDVKQIGAGESAERVDIVRFNAALLEQYRATLDDLAKETGGRKQRLEHSGHIDIDVTKLSDDELRAIIET